MKNLYIVGAGGFGREVAWLAERINEKKPTWKINGFIDDNIKIHGGQANGYPILGGSDYLCKLDDESWVVCAVGATKNRKKIIDMLQTNTNVKFATLIDPSAQCSNLISIGEGTIICAGSIVTVNIMIGKHVIINLDCTVGHDTIIEDYVTVNPSVNLSGNVTVGECTELGTGAHVIQGKHLGRQSIIGAGAVVIRDIPDKCTAVGNPAKPIKFFE